MLVGGETAAALSPTRTPFASVRSSSLCFTIFTPSQQVVKSYYMVKHMGVHS